MEIIIVNRTIHCRVPHWLDKISTLHLNAKLKGHPLLRQAGLDEHMRNMIIGAASGRYDVISISNSLRQAFRSSSLQVPPPPGYNTHTTPYLRGCCRARGRGRGAGGSRSQSPQIIPSFYTFNTTNPNIYAIINSGASASEVGHETLDSAMQSLGINSINEPTDLVITSTNKRNRSHLNYLSIYC